jgi:hypothetical protein
MIYTGDYKRGVWLVGGTAIVIIVIAIYLVTMWARA